MGLISESRPFIAAQRKGCRRDGRGGIEENPLISVAILFGQFEVFGLSYGAVVVMDLDVC